LRHGVDYKRHCSVPVTAQKQKQGVLCLRHTNSLLSAVNGTEAIPALSLLSLPVQAYLQWLKVAHR